MIAYSRGSQSLAGTASVRHRMPAVVGTFCTLDIAQWQSNSLISCPSRVRLPLSHLSRKQAPQKG
jgi:hypothetical protein